MDLFGNNAREIRDTPYIASRVRQSRGHRAVLELSGATEFASCKYIIDTTIGAATYEIGVPSCGGPVNIAVITRSGFKWVHEPKFTLPTNSNSFSNDADSEPRSDPAGGPKTREAAKGKPRVKPSRLGRSLARKTHFYW